MGEEDLLSCLRGLNRAESVIYQLVDDKVSGIRNMHCMLRVGTRLVRYGLFSYWQINVGSWIKPIQDCHTCLNSEYYSNEDIESTENMFWREVHRTSRRLLKD